STLHQNHTKQEQAPYAESIFPGSICSGAGRTRVSAGRRESRLQALQGRVSERERSRITRSLRTEREISLALSSGGCRNRRHRCTCEVQSAGWQKSGINSQGR